MADTLQADYLVSRPPLHVDPGICGPCEGQCCKRGPGIAFPCDFGITVADVKRNVRAAMQTGLWSVSFMYGDIGSTKQRGRDAFYVRPRKMNGELFDDNSRGRCVLLTEDGCRLPPDRRPTQCRMLKPSVGDTCYMEDDASMKRAAVLWFTYNAFFKGIIDKWERGGRK